MHQCVCVFVRVLASKDGCRSRCLAQEKLAALEGAESYTRTQPRGRYPSLFNACEFQNSCSSCQARRTKHEFPHHCCPLTAGVVAL